MVSSIAILAYVGSVGRLSRINQMTIVPISLRDKKWRFGKFPNEFARNSEKFAKRVSSLCLENLRFCSIIG